MPAVSDRSTDRTEVVPEMLWVHPCVVVRDSSIEGRGLFVTEDLPQGEIVIRLSGRLVSTDELARLIEHANANPSHAYVDTLTIYENVHLVLPPESAVHYGNHSCDPTMWHVGPFEIATRRAVHVGEELTIDYANMQFEAGADAITLPDHATGDLVSGEYYHRYLEEMHQEFAQRIDRTTKIDGPHYFK